MIYNTLENDFWLMQITCFQIKKEQFEKIFIYMKSGVGSGGRRLGSRGFYVQPIVFRRPGLIVKTSMQNQDE